MNTVTDKAGQPLRPGDLIIYGHALGRCAGLQYGKVLEVMEPRVDEYRFEQETPRIRVQGVDRDDNYLGYRLRAERKPRETTRLRPSTLNFPSRILRITREQVPADVLVLLDGVLPSNTGSA